MLPLFNRLKSDESLMLAYQGGDAGAFELLYKRHKDGLFAFLFRNYPRYAVAEELAQETWVAVINAAARYKSEARFRTWLYQIAHNKLVDHWRRPDNRHTPFDTAAEVSTINEDAIDPLESRIFKERLMTALATLPRDQKDAILLQEQGFSHADIAEITGVGAETVKSRLRYARHQMREQLGEIL
jgi:RNA polymerase sigma-70 factor (ECF subfamily)